MPFEIKLLAVAVLVSVSLAGWKVFRRASLPMLLVLAPFLAIWFWITVPYVWLILRWAK
jgi:hypothetical protein